MTDLTRRQLGLIALGSVVVAEAAAQATPDLLAQAVASKREVAADLAKFEIEMAVEPAFQFKA